MCECMIPRSILTMSHICICTQLCIYVVSMYIYTCVHTCSCVCTYAVLLFTQICSFRLAWTDRWAPSQSSHSRSLPSTPTTWRLLYTLCVLASSRIGYLALHANKKHYCHRAPSASESATHGVPCGRRSFKLLAQAPNHHAGSWPALLKLLQPGADWLLFRSRRRLGWLSEVPAI